MNYRRIILLVSATGLLAGCGAKHKLSTDSPEALRYYQQGLASFEKFYYAEARDDLSRALKADSTFAMAWARLAMTDFEARNESDASAEIGNAEKYAANATERERLFIRLCDHRIHYANHEAAVLADSMIRMFPDEKEIYLVRGNLYELNKNPEGAIKSYEKAVAIDSTYGRATMSLGYAYMSVGETEKSIEFMQRYIRLQPDAADPRASYADLLVRTGRYDEALEQYKKSLELKPDYWYAVREIGRVYVILGRLQEAERQFHQAFKLLPGHPTREAEHLMMDGYINSQRGKYQEAVQQFLAALRIDTTLGDAAFGLVRAFTKLKDFRKADDEIERIHEEFQRRNLTDTRLMLNFHLIKAVVLTGEDSLNEALEECESALQYSSPIDQGFVYRQIAEIRLQQGAFEPALDACDEGLSLNPNFPDCLLTLMRVYHAKGDVRMTVEIGGRLLALWKDADPDFQSLLEVQRTLGRKPVS